MFFPFFFIAKPLTESRNRCYNNPAVSYGNKNHREAKDIQRTESHCCTKQRQDSGPCRCTAVRRTNEKIVDRGQKSQ